MPSVSIRFLREEERAIARGRQVVLVHGARVSPKEENASERAGDKERHTLCDRLTKRVHQGLSQGRLSRAQRDG
jgi:hypothetical protein